MLSAFDSALGSEAASDLDSGLLSDSGSALELPDAVLDDADDELLVLWEELPELAEEDRKSTRLNSSHYARSRMPSSA